MSINNNDNTDGTGSNSEGLRNEDTILVSHDSAVNDNSVRNILFIAYLLASCSNANDVNSNILSLSLQVGSHFTRQRRPEMTDEAFDNVFLRQPILNASPELMSAASQAGVTLTTQGLFRMPANYLISLKHGVTRNESVPYARESNISSMNGTVFS